VVVTRAAHQAAGLAAAFGAAGARVELLPLLAVTAPEDPAPLSEALAALAGFDWMVFTSANAVGPVAERLAGPLPERLRVAVVGPATAAAARERGLPVHLEAEKAEAEGLVEALAEAPGGAPTGKKFLLPQAGDARPVLAEGLRAAGAEVTAVVAYGKGLPPEARERARELFAREPLGWVTFTSPRIVRHFVRVMETFEAGSWERRRGELRAVSIGAVTTRELAARGVSPAAEAERPGEEEMVAAVIQVVAAAGGGAADGASRQAREDRLRP
jgi:uroporphyrinogen-III synthase